MLRVIVAAAALVSIASPASAQDETAPDEEAQALFTAGRVAYDAGRYEDALARFRESFDHSGRPGLLYNIGMSADRLRRDEEALDAFEQYLERVPDAENRGSVQNRVDALRRVLAEREQNAALVPSAAETAAASPATTAPGPVEPLAEDDGGSVLGSWWLWTIIGLVVAGGVVAGVLVATSGDSQQPPLDGDYGVVVMTLGGE